MKLRSRGVRPARLRLEGRAHPLYEVTQPRVRPARLRLEGRTSIVTKNAGDGGTLGERESLMWESHPLKRVGLKGTHSVLYPEGLVEWDR
jgi:hypothetical protein